MVKNIIQIITLSLIYSLSYAQDYEWDFKDETANLFAHSIFPTELNHGFIASLSTQERATNVYKINVTTGEIEKLQKVPWNSMSSGIERLVYIKETSNLILISGYSKWAASESEKDSFYLSAVVMDTFLNIIKKNLYFITDRSMFYHMDYLLTDDNDILLTANIWFNNPVVENNQLITARFSSEGELKDHEIIRFDTHPTCFTLVPDINRDGYLCIGRWIFLLDNEFNLKEILPERIREFPPSSQIKARKWGSNHYLIATYVGGEYKEFKQGSTIMYLMDKDFKVVKYTGIPVNIEFAYAMPSSVYDITSDSMIYLSNTQDAFMGLQRFTVSKFDKHLNHIWRMDFSRTGEYRYWMWGVATTQDDGFAVYGTRHIWDPDSRHGYIIKFNKDGNLISASDDHHPDIQYVKVYPNPVGDICTMELHGFVTACDLRIFDQSGRNVYVRTNISNGPHQVDMSMLRSGAYHYKLYDKKGRELTGGSLVKM